MKTLALTLALCALALPATAQDTAAAALLAGYEAAAGAPADAAAGRDLFLANHTGGKPDTPSCTTCHGTDPTKAGQARIGNLPLPIAVIGHEGGTVLVVLNGLRLLADPIRKARG